MVNARSLFNSLFGNESSPFDGDIAVISIDLEPSPSSVEDEIARQSTRIHAYKTDTVYTDGPAKMRVTTAAGQHVLLIEQPDGAFRMYAVVTADDPVLEDATNTISHDNVILMPVRPCRNCTGHVLAAHDDHDSEKNFSAMIAKIEAFSGFPDLGDIDGLDDLS